MNPNTCPACPCPCADELEDFADVMREGLAAIVEWYEASAGNPLEPVEIYDLKVEALRFVDGSVLAYLEDEEGESMGTITFDDGELDELLGV